MTTTTTTTRPITLPLAHARGVTTTTTMTMTRPITLPLAHARRVISSWKGNNRLDYELISVLSGTCTLTCT